MSELRTGFIIYTCTYAMFTTPTDTLKDDFLSMIVIIITLYGYLSSFYSS